jgi:carbon storage regulator CsrA
MEISSMLVLSRKSNESVVVGGNDRCERMLKVTVLEIDGSRVRLGFEVDSDVPVHRFEVWERIHAGPRRAGAGLLERKTMPVGL